MRVRETRVEREESGREREGRVGERDEDRRETRARERHGQERSRGRREPVAMARREEEGDGGRRGRDEGMANLRPRRDARLKCIMSET